MRLASFADRPMKRWEIALAIAGVVCLLLGARWIRRGELPKQDQVLTGAGCQMPLTVINPPPDVAPAGSMILIHGLSANRRLMTYLGEDFAGHGFRAYLLDLPGHGDNTDPFTFARAQQCASVAVELLIRAGRVDPKTAVLLGHSMGAGIAIRMADREPVAATIAISPGPMPLPQRMPANLLVFSAQYEIGLLKRQAEKIQQAAGGFRTQHEDFAQQRAFDLRRVAHATHTSLIVDRNVAHQSEMWAMQALFPNIARETLALNLDLATYEAYKQGRRRLAGAVIGFLGLLVLFPLAASLAAKTATSPRRGEEFSHPPASLSLVEGLVFSFAGVLILMIGTPLKFFHLYAGDYLASLLFIVGVLFLALNRKDAAANFSMTIRQNFAALVLGLATILAFGVWLNWQMTDAWLNAPRWLRFAGLLPILWIYSYAEEVVLGPVQAGKRRALRFAIFLLLRLELWAACAVAAYSLSSGHLLIVILFTFLAAFSILQRLATDALRLRVGSAAAAALFSAILAAWLIAAVFPLT
jgi:pimeloyl-ACP methyl ester carboxylesterase